MVIDFTSSFSSGHWGKSINFFLSAGLEQGFAGVNGQSFIKKVYRTKQNYIPKMCLVIKKINKTRLVDFGTKGTLPIFKTDMTIYQSEAILDMKKFCLVKSLIF